MKITKDVKYIGVNDHEIDLFEGQYVVPNGMAYNSYVILDDKIAVMDTVDARFCKQWLSNLKKALKGRTVDYLVIQHVEPDHSSSIVAFAETYPEATIVSNAKAFTLIDNFYGELGLKRMTVAESDTLSLGSHTLSFVFAPMVHWPEVMVSYDATDKILFSADGFGKFGALDVEEEWACEARRYYFGIVGKYGMPVQQLLKKAATLNIAIICPLHGPILNDNLGYYLDLYNTWSGYGVESEGVCICYTSVYGHTRAAAELLAAELEKRGCAKVAVNDLARCDMAEALEDAFRYGKLVLATTTYNASIFPFMHDFVTRLAEHGYQNRTVGLIENGSWAPQAANVIKNLMSGCKNLTFTDTTVTIHSSLNAESRAQTTQLADELVR
ncbi:MAG: MBL fold metallo-hydrolase [Clostridiales bacterium]|nr:MBL fold metallo-hydrolase [Clostridiales bacterium]